MKITKTQLKQIIKEEMTRMNESSVEHNSDYYEDDPQVGDRWVWDGPDGQEIFKEVTQVFPPSDSSPVWSIALDNESPQPLDWWKSQGWLKVDDYSLFPAGFKDGLKGRVPHFHDNPDYMRGHTVGKMRRYYSSDDQMTLRQINS